jgi:hypothetical protein
MRSNPAASTFMSALLWSILFVSLFAAPVLMAARSADGGPDEHTADLIRQHQDATSPYSPAPAAEGEQLDSRACGRPEDGSAVAGEGTARRSARPDDEPVIRPAANRAKRIQV